MTRKVTHWLSVFCVRLTIEGLHKQRLVLLELLELSTTNLSLDLFVQIKMLGNGIRAEAFRQKFSQPPHVEEIYYASVMS